MSENRRLFHVSCNVTVDMVVLAEDEEEANAIGAMSWQDEIEEYDLDPDDFSAKEITARKQIDWIEDEDLDSTCPYEAEGSESGESVQEHLDDLGIE
jgi:hypothetical protein